MDGIIIVGFCVVILILILFFYLKDKQTDSKFERYDTIINDQMNEIFLLKKDVTKLNSTIENLQKTQDEFNIGNFSDIIEQQIDEKIEPLLSSFEGIDKLVKKNLSSNDDESNVLKDFSDGKTIDEIMLDRNLSRNRVEFILKFNKVI